ncbi:MAG: YdcF family protein [Chitinispirillaceae bacterium]
MKTTKLFTIPSAVAGSFLLVSATAITVLGLRDDIAYSDVGVVMGNTVLPSGVPSDRLKGRLDKCIELYRKGYLGKIIVSGARGREGHVESVVMKEYLESKGIDESVIIEDCNGRNTFETARFTSRYCRTHNLSSAMVITQFFHIPRSRYALKRFGVKYVHKAHADYFEWRDVPSLFREVAAMVKYVLRRYPGK